MKYFRLASFAVFLFALAVLPAFGQYSFTLTTNGQSICSVTKYASKIACLPTKAANYEIHNMAGYFDPNTGEFTAKIVIDSVPLAIPFGLGTQYASQLATSPSAATSAGYVFTFVKGALSAKPTDLGPLLSDLPQTIDKNRLYIGASYQWMEFSKTGGKDLSSFLFPGGFFDSRTVYGYNFNQANASLKMNSINTYFSFGITSRLEVSAVIPWSHVDMSIKTSCAPAAYGVESGWVYNGNQPECATTGTAVAINGTDGLPITISGHPEYDVTFTVPNSQTQTSSGIGDVTLRAKYEIVKKNRQGLAIGLEYRLPTGDPLDIQGSGATGIRPFLAWGYNGRLSPHINAGYQYNGSSVDDVRDNATSDTEITKSGTFTTVATTVKYSDVLPPRKLPNIITVSGGADFALTKRLNLNADLLARFLSNDGSSTWNGKVGDISLVNNPVTKAPFFDGASTKTTAVFGAKAKLASHLLLSGSVMIDASNNGLSYKPSPIATLSYDFGGAKK